METSVKELSDKGLIDMWYNWNDKIINYPGWGVDLTALDEFRNECEVEMHRRNIPVPNDPLHEKIRRAQINAGEKVVVEHLEQLGIKQSPLKKAISYLDQTQSGTPMETAEKFKMIYQEILDELQRALIKFPSFNSAHEGWAIIQKEQDELWEAVRLNQATPGRSTKMYSKAKQVAAMAIRFMLDMPGFKN